MLNIDIRPRGGIWPSQPAIYYSVEVLRSYKWRSYPEYQQLIIVVLDEQDELSVAIHLAFSPLANNTREQVFEMRKPLFIFPCCGAESSCTCILSASKGASPVLVSVLYVANS